MFEGVLITEIGGYCSMWNLFHFDLRLKTLKRTSGEVYTDMIKLMRDDTPFAVLDGASGGTKFIELMRGMSKYAWKQLEVAMKPQYNKGGDSGIPATRQEYIQYLDDSGKMGRDRHNAVWDSIYKLRMDIMEKKFGLTFA